MNAPAILQHMVCSNYICINIAFRIVFLHIRRNDCRQINYRVYILFRKFFKFFRLCNIYRIIWNSPFFKEVCLSFSRCNYLIFFWIKIFSRLFQNIRTNISRSPKNNYFFHSTFPPVLLPPLLLRPYHSLYISDHREAVPYFY